MTEQTATLRLRQPLPAGAIKPAAQAKPMPSKPPEAQATEPPASQAASKPYTRRSRKELRALASRVFASIQGQGFSPSEAVYMLWHALELAYLRLAAQNKWSPADTSATVSGNAQCCAVRLARAMIREQEES